MSDSEPAVHPVIRFNRRIKEINFTAGYDADEMDRFIHNGGRAVGGYNENRKNMYLAPQYENRRHIHMGLDFWAPVGEPVFAVVDGVIAYKAFHDQTGNYGATIVLEHRWKGNQLFALYGHLSLRSLDCVKIGESVEAGNKVGWLGEKSENGNWPPHLHYQLSWKDPKEADMPGVVSKDERDKALKIYPDPKKVFGDLY